MSFRDGLLPALYLLLFICAACGGGTSGTGVESIQGVLLDSRGNPISEVTISAPSTGDTVSTNDEGEFVINVIGDTAGEVELVFDSQNAESTVVVSSLGPEEEGPRETVFIFNSETGEVLPESS